jgi:hypothetical protein
MSIPAPIAGNQYYTGVQNLYEDTAQLRVGKLTATAVSAAVTDSTLLSSGGAVANTMVIGRVDLSQSTQATDCLAILDSSGVPITIPARSQVYRASYKSLDPAVTPLTTFNFGFGVAGTFLAGGLLLGTESLVQAGTAALAIGGVGGVVSGVSSLTTLLGGTGAPVNTYGLQVPVNKEALVLNGIAAGQTGVLEVTLHYAAVRS